jgi:hypothetical protein
VPGRRAKSSWRRTDAIVEGTALSAAAVDGEAAAAGGFDSRASVDGDAVKDVAALSLQVNSGTVGHSEYLKNIQNVPLRRTVQAKNPQSLKNSRISRFSGWYWMPMVQVGFAPNGVEALWQARAHPSRAQVK